MYGEDELQIKIPRSGDELDNCHLNNVVSTYVFTPDNSIICSSRAALSLRFTMRAGIDAFSASLEAR